MDKAQRLRRIEEIRALVNSLQKELHQLEAMYIADLSRLCHHSFDQPWVTLKDGTEINHCSNCGIKVKK